MPSKPVKFACNALAATASFILIFSMLFASLALVMNDRNYYLNKYEQLDMERTIGIPPKDCADAIMALIDYMEGRVDSIDLNVNESGVEVSMYNDRERAHMVDVRALYQMFRGIAVYGAIAAAAIIAMVAALLKRSRPLVITTLGHGFARAMWAFVAVVLIFGAWAAIDFTNFWTSFHLAFFTNDLWLLNYATDRMIRICPEELFFELIMRFGIIFIVASVAITSVVRIFTKRAEVALKKAQGEATNSRGRKSK